MLLKNFEQIVKNYAAYSLHIRLLALFGGTSVSQSQILDKDFRKYL